MNERKLIKQATAVLNIPKAVRDCILFAQKVGRMMGVSPYFPASSALIAKLVADTIILDDLETVCVTTPLTTNTKARDAARIVVENDLRDLRLDVQKVANADPLNAEIIITSAGMSVKMPGNRGKQQNEAVDGVEEGTIDLIAEGAGPHEWRISTDEKEWTKLDSSRTSTTVVRGLTPGVLYSVQNRMMLTNNEKTEWSQSVKIRVR
ncbi:MAG TPA: hypothetical protein VFC67_09855 [Prolixibacteraceae bacterium]|nr:hypothetical protein [Prolixibacteraceae bacterium]